MDVADCDVYAIGLLYLSDGFIIPDTLRQESAKCEEYCVFNE